MDRQLPYMLITVIGAMLIVLFLLFRSVVLPVQAVVAALLSLTASFGALVFIFQHGRVVTTPNGRIVADQFWFGDAQQVYDDIRHGSAVQHRPDDHADRSASRRARARRWASTR